VQQLRNEIDETGRRYFEMNSTNNKEDDQISQEIEKLHIKLNTSRYFVDVLCF